MTTMTPKAFFVNNYVFGSEDQLFLDANIWLFLYGPQQSPIRNRVKAYSQAFKRILIANSQIHIDALIVSEFINSYSRIIWRNASPTVNFKQFRNSRQFRLFAQNIAADVRNVLKHCSPIESGFSSLDMNELLDEYAAGGVDFNDQVISVLCRTKGLTLITNDGDFRGQGIRILTANRRLLV